MNDETRKWVLALTDHQRSLLSLWSAYSAWIDSGWASVPARLPELWETFLTSAVSQYNREQATLWAERASKHMAMLELYRVDLPRLEALLGPETTSRPHYVSPVPSPQSGQEVSNGL